MLGVATLAIAFNWLGALQRDVPGYTTALEDHIESTDSACTQLQQLSGEHQNQFAAANARLEGKKATCAATDKGDSQSGHLAAGNDDDHDDDANTTGTSRAEAVGVHGQQDEPARPRPGPELHGHHGLVQHPGRPAAHAERAARQGGADRLLDLFVHQLPAGPASR